MFETEMWLSQASKPDEDKKSNQTICQIDDFETWYKNHKFKKGDKYVEKPKSLQQMRRDCQGLHMGHQLR